MTLGGCAAKTERPIDIKSTGVREPYPPLPSDQVAGCKPPQIVVGVNAKIAWARAEEAYQNCAAKQRRMVRFYENLRRTK